ncbi:MULTISPECIES: hypothetical protein [Actinomycetes]|uniref:hypothetical protein n=1 Tax=Micromonospora sp. NPDC005367 TaxID=3155590 RepID=UPI0033BD1322
MLNPSIAEIVLTEAALLDPRVTYNDDTITAWDRVFADEPVFVSDALKAVRVHYKKPRAKRLLPGDVVTYCREQPIWSSAERANYFLDEWTQHPYATAIHDVSGIRQPEAVLDAPDRETAVAELTRWVDGNRETLVNAILTNRGRPTAY